MTEMLIIVLDLATLFGVAWWLYGKQTEDVKSYYWPALSVKLLAGLAVGWLYFFHYGQGDTITYWHDGLLLPTRLSSDPWGVLKFFWSEETEPKAFAELINDKPRSLFFVKTCGILALLSGGNYWAMGLIISFVSFLGSWYLFSMTLKFFPASRVAAAISFLFYPSVVFWSSGLIKESLGLAALFFLTGFCATIMKNHRPMRWEWAMLLLSLWIGWNLKYYWIGVFLPVSATTVAVIILNNWRPALKRKNRLCL